ncbi:MAG: carbon-nitrogen hydrolase family protein [Bifidobacterium angulatum]
MAEFKQSTTEVPSARTGAPMVEQAAAHATRFSMKRRVTAAVAAVGSIALCATMAFAGGSTAYADTYSSTQTAIAATVTSGTIPAGQLAVVNFHPTWGDKQANKASMLKYIADAHANGVKMIVFPEMALTGYVSSSDPDSAAYRMAVSQAETTESPITREIAQAAAANGMWVVYGTSEKIPGDTSHAYNSAFAISPKGQVSAYQKIAPVEGDWATPGSTPVILQTEWGLMGLSICYDTYAQPEIERYYAAQGVSLLVNPTATSRSYADIDGDGVKDAKGWEWYYKNRLESIASRDGLTIASADLVGKDGYAGEGESQPYDFPGGSVILQGGFSAAKYYAGLNADGTILTAKEGALVNDKDMRLTVGSTTKVANDFHPDYYAKWYAELANKQESGQSLSYRYGSSNAPTTAVANVSAVWGDKEKNTEMMLKYIDEAHSKDVDIIVFPETILTGYDSTDPKGKDDAHTSNASVNTLLAKSDDYMQVVLAEKVKGTDGDTTRGESVQKIAAAAKKYGMYVVFGLPEMPDGGPITDSDGVKKVYNSAAVAFPDGHTDSFQKMHRAGSEETAWSMPGSKPLMFELPEWKDANGNPLKAGVDICRDGHFYPELGRYYAASGAELLLHPTATTGNAWYRETRMGSYTDRDGLGVVTDNVWGPDGYPLDSDGNPIYSVDDNGKTVSSGKTVAGYNYMGVGYDPFRTSSLIINSWNGKNGTAFDYATGSALDTSGTGKGASLSESADMTFAEGSYDPDNLEYRSMNLKSAGFRVMNFQARLYSRMYDQLAKQFIVGYQSMYPESSALDKTALADPIARAVVKLAESDKYTDDTLSALTNAYEQALSLQNNITFSSEQSDLVTAAAKQLDEAIVGLQVKSADNGKANLTKPSDNGDAADFVAGSTTEGVKQKSNETTSANTGSSVASVVMVMILLLGAGTTVGAYAWRKTVGR